MNLLQQNETNVFVLATEGHLGHLRDLDIWFDSIGPNPSWYVLVFVFVFFFKRSAYFVRYCREITIFDMQKKMHWYYNVNTRFCVKEGLTYVSVKSSKQKEENFFKFPSWRSQFCNYRHTWNFSTKEDNFTYFKRICLILSNFLLVYALVLLFQVRPNLKMNDMMDFEDIVYRVDMCFIALGVSFMSFLIHYTISLVFR